MKKRKADVVIWEIADPDEDEETFLSQVSEYAKDFAEIIEPSWGRKKAA